MKTTFAFLALVAVFSIGAAVLKDFDTFHNTAEMLRALAILSGLGAFISFCGGY